MRHNSTAMDASAKIVRVTNCTRLWDIEFAWYSPRATRRIWFSCLEHSRRIQGFRLIWPFLVVEFLAVWANFLQPSGYKSVINCPFTFRTKDVFVCFYGGMAPVRIRIRFQIGPRCTFICATFKSLIEWSNAQRVSSPTTTILLNTIAGTFSLAWTDLVTSYIPYHVHKYCKVFQSTWYVST